MDAQWDALGNVVGRYRGQEDSLPTVIAGSHMDTVIDAGKYDGVFGILCTIACVQETARCVLWEPEAGDCLR